MELTLTPDIEKAIVEQADLQGTTPEQLALAGLRNLFISAAKQADESTASLAEFLDGYIGVIHSSERVEGGANLSEDTGTKFAQIVMQKRAQDQR